MNTSKESTFKELKKIPGVGKEIAEDFWNIGIRSVTDLRGKNPESLYYKLTKYEGRHVDRCMLYVFRCAVYYASNRKHNPRLLKWWNWSDAALRGKK
ncbi:pathogenicity locus [Candidatus Parcubacteria bacterium]|nr:MAG: pathogenicity locus [Candidatus Parcubacteria bacterium]